jgi:hypothetical protein
MKKIFLASLALSVFAASIVLFQMSSCTKAVAQTKVDTIFKCPSNIVGLWEGTYTVASNKSYYFSFSIYPNGKMSYRGDAYYYTMEYNAYAEGTWTLNGNQFSFNVKTINQPSGIQHPQYGYATYNGTDASLTNGHIADSISGDPSSWTMTKVN